MDCPGGTDWQELMDAEETDSERRFQPTTYEQRKGNGSASGLQPKAVR
jgi:hypothetical protein